MQLDEAVRTFIAAAQRVGDSASSAFGEDADFEVSVGSRSSGVRVTITNRLPKAGRIIVPSDLSELEPVGVDDEGNGSIVADVKPSSVADSLNAGTVPLEETPKPVKKKRKRRTKAEIAAAKAEEELAKTPKESVSLEDAGLSSPEVEAPPANNEPVEVDTSGDDDILGDLDLADESSGAEVGDENDVSALDDDFSETGSPEAVQEAGITDDLDDLLN